MIMARNYAVKRGISSGYGRRQINRLADVRLAQLALFCEAEGLMPLNQAIERIARYIVETQPMRTGKKMLMKSAKERLSIALRSIVPEKQSSGI
jgi:hypothetical protein